MRPVIVVLAVSALSLAACGRKDETPKPGLKVGPGGSVTITGKDGAVVRSGANVKADLPDFAPLYPGAAPSGSVTSVASAEGKGGMYVYTAAAFPEQVLAFYRDKAKAAGLGEAAEMNMGAARMFSATDEASRRSLQVIVTGEGSGSNVSLTWSVPKA
ncbi:MAG TPA: hypothetical protein PLF78_07900 [Caulobacter sp.]|nr:hypothetical protein [Caulobacter sp.]